MSYQYLHKFLTVSFSLKKNVVYLIIVKFIKYSIHAGLGLELGLRGNCNIF